MNEVVIYPLSDLHLGNRNFDDVKLKRWIEDFEKCKKEKIIYCLGDMLDSSVVYNNSYEKEKKRLDEILNKLKPYIRKYVKGNNDYFIEKNGLKIYNNKPTYSFKDSLDINNRIFNVYGIHTMNKFIMKSDIKDRLDEYDKDVDIYLQGHYHFGHYINDNGKYYIFNSCFLKNTDNLFKIIIDSKHNVTVDEI